MSGDTGSFGAVLRRLRASSALSQEQLAERAGLSLRGISDLERGARRVPHLATVRLLSDALALEAADRETLLAAARPLTRGAFLAGAFSPVPLPVPLTSLIGRERELADLASLLMRTDVRIVTLTGPGGVGKTRLALELAAQLGNDFDDGITFASLAPVRDSDLVAAAIAHAVGVRETIDHLPIDAVVAALRPREHLLVLDNFEQVVAAAPAIAELLAACPRLKALVTSRQVLHISGERDYPLEPLPLPPASAASIPERLTDYAAVRLFAERVQAAEPSFVLTADCAPAVVAICRQLDGLPLAIELAAVRSRVLPPDALLPRLTRRLELLTTGARDAPPRQRTLRDAIGWSYDLLTEEERRVFRRLSVFAGGFTLEAAEHVGLMAPARRSGAPLSVGSSSSSVFHLPPEGPQLSILDLVAALADKSLLQPVAQESGEPRFGMLETIREFGLEQLAASGEEAATRNAHAAYFLTLARRLDDRLLDPEQGRRLRELELEHDNFRAALSWTLGRSDPLGLRLATVLGWFWRLHGHLREGRSWLERALASGAESESIDFVQAGLELAILVDELGDAARAGELFHGSLAASQAIGDRESVATAAHNLGLLALDQGDFATAEAFLEQSLTFSREVDDRQGIGLALLCLGTALRVQGVMAAARPLFEESLAQFRAVGDRQRVARVFHNLGLLAMEEGALEQSAALLAESLALFRQVEHRLGIAEVLNDLGWLELASGEPTAAANRFAEGLTIFNDMGSLRGVGRVLDGCACLAAGSQPVLALRLAGSASVLRERTSSVLFPAEETRLERRLAVARQAVSQPAEAWHVGRTMPYEQAVGDAFAFLAEPAPAVESGGPSDPIAQHGLSPRELQVLRLVAEGRSNREIAEALFISRRTATTHMTHLFTKLGLDSRAAAAAYAVRHGLA